MVSAIRLEGVSTEKNCVEQFLTKQKTNIWKARESKTGVWENNSYYVNNNY